MIHPLRALVATIPLAAGAVALARPASADAGLGPDARATDTVASDAERAGFDIWEIRVLGNTVLEAPQIESAVYPHLGPARSIRDVEAARDALVQVYRDRGYGTVFVDIPEQDVPDGVVRLQVTEGRIDRVRISGARYFRNGAIRAAVPALEPDSVPRLPELQEQLGRVNQQSRDRVVTPVLRAGRTPGTLDVELKVKDSLPLHASVELNDRYTADTARLRAKLDLSYENLFQRFHSLSLQFQTAPEERNDARVLAATYVMPVQRFNDYAAFYVVDTNSDVAAIGTLSVIGAGRIYGGRYIATLPPAGAYGHSLTFGADLKDFAENIRIDDDTGLETPIRYVNWSLAYRGDLRRERWSGGLSAEVNFGLRGLGNSPQEFGDKRFLARPNYVYLRAAADVAVPLPARFQAALRVAGQYSGDPLISNEQFSVGGADSVRGYLESEALGDYGVQASLELRSPPLLGRWDADGAHRLVAVAFGDGAIVHIHDALPKQDSGTNLASVGLGLRYTGAWGLTGMLDWAYPLISTDRVAAGDSRLHMSVRYGF
jgi:hemolysin activation/secretion protein